MHEANLTSVIWMLKLRQEKVSFKNFYYRDTFSFNFSINYYLVGQ